MGKSSAPCSLLQSARREICRDGQSGLYDSPLEETRACVPNRTSPHDLSYRTCTGIDFPFTLVEALIFALALSVLSSLQPDAAAASAARAHVTSSSGSSNSRSSARQKERSMEFRPGRPPPRPPAARGGDRSSIVAASAPATKPSCR